MREEKERERESFSGSRSRVKINPSTHTQKNVSLPVFLCCCSSEKIPILHHTMARAFSPLSCSVLKKMKEQKKRVLTKRKKSEFSRNFFFLRSSPFLLRRRLLLLFLPFFRFFFFCNLFPPPIWRQMRASSSGDGRYVHVHACKRASEQETKSISVSFYAAATAWRPPPRPSWPSP